MMFLVATILLVGCINRPQDTAPTNAIAGHIVDSEGKHVANALVDVGFTLSPASATSRAMQKVADTVRMPVRPVQRCVDVIVLEYHTLDTVYKSVGCSTFYRAGSRNGAYIHLFRGTDTVHEQRLLRNLDYESGDPLQPPRGYDTTDAKGRFSFPQEVLPFGERYEMVDSLGRSLDSMEVTRYLTLWCFYGNRYYRLADSLFINEHDGLSSEFTVSMEDW
jgi:hypothetical protein